MLTPLKAIRAKCLDCSGGQPKEVRFCPVEDCPLHHLRFGKNPALKGKRGLRGRFDTVQARKGAEMSSVATYFGKNPYSGDK